MRSPRSRAWACGLHAAVRRGQIIISSIMSVANGLLPAIVAKYRASRPGIEIILREGVHGTVLEDIRSGTADLGATYVDDVSLLLRFEAPRDPPLGKLSKYLHPRASRVCCSSATARANQVGVG
jgi:DNA-binding transcriptional LysR family regulator